VTRLTCRGLNSTGAIAGYTPLNNDVYWDVALARPVGLELARVHVPFAPPPGTIYRGELLMDVAEDGSMVGYVYQREPYFDAADEAYRYRPTFHAVELKPIDALPHTSFDDTPYGYVEPTLVVEP